MISRFKKFIEKENLFTEENKVLLAISGGVDSMVMCDLFHKAGIPFGMAHCNFGLRGAESDQDEAFVIDRAKELEVECHKEHFYPKDHLENENVSIQMAARTQRYEWFEKMRAKHGYDFIATAHHKNDVIETVLFNLTKGTGIAGLHGILSKREKIVRPLLFATKEDMIAYAEENEVAFREDSSNESVKYARNKIRLEIIPKLKEINPDLENTFKENLERIKDVELIFRQCIEKRKKQIVREDSQNVLINIEELNKREPVRTILFEILKDYNFNTDVVHQIVEVLDEQPGKKFFSSSHQLIKDRTDLILTKLTKNEHIVAMIQVDQSKFENGQLTMTFDKLENKDFSIPCDSHIACLDYEKLQHPLKLRKWQEGDAFYPLGMEQKKKLSDFFIDEKISLNEKESTWILTSDDDIIWVVGKRIDNRYRITEETKTIYQILITSNNP